MSEELFNYNVQTVGKLFNNGMQLLWPFRDKYENVLIFVTTPSFYGEDIRLYVISKSDLFN